MNAWAKSKAYRQHSIWYAGLNPIQPLRFFQPHCTLCPPPAHLNRHIQFDGCFPILIFCCFGSFWGQTLLQNPHMAVKCKAHRLFFKCWQKEECNFPLRRETWSIPLIVERLTKPSFRWKVSLCDKGLFLHLVIRPCCTELVLKVHRHKAVQAARLRSQILPRLWIVTWWWPWQKPRFYLNK